MNKIKEKKINAIKSEILEIKDFVASSIDDDKSNISDLSEKIDEDSNDTLTLTNIIDYKKNESNKDLLTIKDELNDLKLMILKQEKILEEVLTKIK